MTAAPPSGLSEPCGREATVGIGTCSWVPMSLLSMSAGIGPAAHSYHSTMSELTEDDVRRIVRSELSEQMAGLSTGSGVDPDKPEAERMAESVMISGDLKAQHEKDLSAVETIERRYGLDPSEYDDADELRAAVRERRGSA